MSPLKNSEVISLEEFKEFINDGTMISLLLAPQVFVMGTRSSENQALEINESIQKAFQGCSQHNLVDNFFEKNRIIELNSTHSDYEYLLSFKMTNGQSDIRGFAFAMLFARTFRHHFIEQLRLKEQLAYSLSLSFKVFQNDSYLLFYIRSPFQPKKLEERIMEYLHCDAVDYLDSLDYQHLSNIYSSVLVSLSSVCVQFFSQAKALWNLMPNFGLNKQIIHFLKNEYSFEKFGSEVRTFLLGCDLDESMRIIVTPNGQRTKICI